MNQAMPPTDTNAILQLSDVCVGYNKNNIIQSASFNLVDNEICCLLGPSGCGKSTLLRSIAGFEPLISGNISMLGEQISTGDYIRPPELREIGLVFQDLALFPHLSIEQNIRFGIKHWSKSDQSKRVSQLLKLVGLAGMERRLPDSLSGGQQQRIALARA